MMKITPDIAELMAIKMEGGHLSEEELQIIADATADGALMSEFTPDQLVPDFSVDSAHDLDDTSLDGALAMDFMDDSNLSQIHMEAFNHDSIIGMPGNEYQQQYSDTCAIKSQQIIMNEFGIPVTEEQLVSYSYQHGWYSGHGTSMDDVGKLLEEGGIPVHRQSNANVFDLVSELAQGHRVIVGVDADELWGDRILGWMEDFYHGEQPDHALIVTGIDTRDPNNIMVCVTDPGTGEHNRAYPLDQFMDAWSDSKCFMVATNIPAPDSLPEMANFDYSAGHINNIAGLSYLEFDIFHGLSEALPIYTMSDMGHYSPMTSLVDAYNDVAMQNTDFADIFNHYDFSNYLDLDVATNYFHDTYNYGMDHINFTPEMSWDTYASVHGIDVYTNDIYADFLTDSINYFEAIGDIDSFNYCSQQMLILDYCDYSDINFCDTFNG